jgi:hypothetical protein
MDLGDLLKISPARCARVSYLSHEGIRDNDADFGLYDKLTSDDPPHASPLEHVATPARPDEYVDGNFKGWHQLRHVSPSIDVTVKTPTPTKANRPGDSQELPNPEANKGQDVQSMVIADIEARRQVGIERYGQALHTFNGRNALLDLYEELIDATMYVKQQLIEDLDAKQTSPTDTPREILGYLAGGIDDLPSWAQNVVRPFVLPYQSGGG